MLTLRNARPDDAEQVACVHVRSWQVAYRGLLADAYLDGLRAEDRAGRYTFDLVGPEHPATTERFYRADGWITDGHRREEDVCGTRVTEIGYRRRLP